MIRKIIFMECLENAFRHFGGVPKRLVIDNLEAAVARADWYDPEIHPKLQSFAQHYGTVIAPTSLQRLVAEGSPKSAKDGELRNALKGRIFTSLAEENQFLMNWETQVADQRIHGTTPRNAAPCRARTWLRTSPAGRGKAASTREASWAVTAVRTPYPRKPSCRKTRRSRQTPAPPEGS